MARRGSDAAGVRRRVIGVARFTDPAVERSLHDCGVETIACDLLDPAQLDRLPDAPPRRLHGWNEIRLDREGSAHVGNQCVSPRIGLPQVFQRAGSSRFRAATFTGRRPSTPAGSCETDPVNPRGEYAMSCVGRERIFEHFSRALGTQVVLIRLKLCDGDALRGARGPRSESRGGRAD